MPKNLSNPQFKRGFILFRHLVLAFQYMYALYFLTKLIKFQFLFKFVLLQCILKQIQNILCTLTFFCWRIRYKSKFEIKERHSYSYPYTYWASKILLFTIYLCAYHVSFFHIWCQGTLLHNVSRSI